MHHIRCIKTVILCVAPVVVIGAPGISRAEPILLAQLYHSRSQPHSPRETFNFIFDVAGEPEGAAGLVRLANMPTVADIGRTFAADDFTVRRFNAALTRSGLVSMQSSFGVVGTTREVYAHEFFRGPFMGDIPSSHSPTTTTLVMKAFVPQLGPNFWGYRITGVNQTIHGFSAEQLNSTTVMYWGAQSIHILGEPIPEPTMWFFVVQALIGFPWRQKRFLASLPDYCD
jgi:hypothetical protein